VLHYIRLESLERDKHPSSLYPFVSYKENEVFRTGTIFSALHFLITN
jgi:hypothetical protein